MLRKDNGWDAVARIASFARDDDRHQWKLWRGVKGHRGRRLGDGRGEQRARDDDEPSDERHYKLNCEAEEGGVSQL